MTDLVTRLGALADTSDDELDTYSHVVTDGWTGQLFKLAKQQTTALREAADALDSQAASIINPVIQELEQEVTALKALLAEAETRHQGLFDAAADAQERAEKAEADVAVYKDERDEALAKLAEAEKQKEVFLDNIQRQAYLTDEARAEAAALREAIAKFTAHGHPYTGSCSADHYTVAACDCGYKDMLDGLSQPGPGAALLEDYRRTQRDYSELFESKDSVLRERNQLQERVRKLESALRIIPGLAGNPDPCEACRVIIKISLAALGEKP